MKTLIFHGYLKDLQPEPIRVHASSVAEAISAMQLYPAFQTGEKHSVAIDGFGSRDAIYDHTDVAEIHIRPMMAGAGRGGLGQILIGVAMIAVAVFAPEVAAAVSLSPGSLALTGAMMALGGILQMIAPQPQLSTSEKSRYLSGAKNTVLIGTRIPMIYGRRKAYGHYISFNIDSGDLNSVPASWYASNFTNNQDTTYAAAPATIPLPPPSIYDSQPQSNFAGVSYPANLTDAPVVYINFSPAITLAQGQWDLNFSNGKTLHVLNATAGSTNQVVLLGGTVDGLPALNTPIIFTRNYV